LLWASRGALVEYRGRAEAWRRLRRSTSARKRLVGMDNPNPEIKSVVRNGGSPTGEELPLEEKIFELLRDIRDPEHPNTLEELSVLDKSSVVVVPPENDLKGVVRVLFSPTVPHCSMASLIGLSIRAKLLVGTAD